MKNRSPSPAAGPRRGAALIITLIMLVLLSILITGFVVSMRTELPASYSSENTQRTNMIAQGAVSHGISLLRADGTVLVWGLDNYGQASPPAGLKPVTGENVFKRESGVTVQLGNNGLNR